MSNEPLSRYVYMVALINILQSCGGAIRSKDAYAALTAAGVARQSDLNTKHANGETRFVKEVRFARQELADAGLIIAEKAGIWILSADGWRSSLTVDEAKELESKRRREGSKASPTLSATRDAVFLPSKGLLPIRWQQLLTREIDGEAWTYVFRFGASNTWKIGFSRDVDKRLREVNRHIPHELLDQRWIHKCAHRWPTVIGAYTMEQALLFALKDSRTHGERVSCDELSLDEKWRTVLTETESVSKLSVSPN